MPSQSFAERHKFIPAAESRPAAMTAAVTGIPEYSVSNKHWFAYICGRLIVNDEKERVSFRPTSYFRPQTSRLANEKNVPPAKKLSFCACSVAKRCRLDGDYD